ncbi:MAG: helix-turn-helix domain-containing protein [Gammaproteobacteria bacterium]|nr:helix-turn-helix domain-containing protein [Gammaproteobacteria bacterium]
MSETPETEPLTTAPGQILKRARESRNLTVAAIATLMNLDLRIVEALERGDQSKLPAPIFVRGYLRGYARLVGVSEAAVLEGYRAQAPQEPVPRAVGMSRVPVRPAFRAPALPWRGLFGVIVVLVAVWLGMQWGPQLIARFSGDAPQETATGITSGETTAPGAELPDIDAPQTLPLDTGTAETPAVETPPAETPSTATGSLELPLPEPRPAPATEPPPATETEPALPGDTDFGAAISGETEPADAATAANPDVNPGVNPATPTAPGDVRLDIRITDDSWVEVRAADGNKLVLGLLHKGDTRNVTGKAPVTVLLGNAAGVEIRVDGKVFDHRRYDRENIARFEIDGKL